jgi:hypothetical protein
MSARKYSTIRGIQEQRLEVQHGSDHRLSPADAASHLDVLQRVEQRKDAALRHTFLDCGRRLLESRAFRRHATQECKRHGDRLAVDHVHLEALHRLRPHSRRFCSRRQLGADVDGDAAVMVFGEPREHLGKLARRRGRGGWQLGRRRESPEELVIGHVDPIAKRLVSEQHLERYDLDLISLAPFVREVGGGVGDHREAPLCRHD